MGEVYKARDTRLDRTVAIKILSTHVITDSQFRTRFDREARAIAALNHPHICTLHDVGHQEGIDFLVMEYLDGQTVADRLAKGAIALDQALTTAIEIADALDKAHRQGIVHRDLKPGNVMLTKSGAKLLDFGLAKLHAAGQPVVQSIPITKSTGLTAQGSILGTLHYMSPEQLEGKEADARSDLFAFGAVVYEMVTGRKAFEGKSHASVIAAILDRDPPPMSVLQPLTPRQLDHVVSRCLAKDPDERWQSSRDLLFELEWLSATQLTSRSDPLNRQSGWRRRIVFTAAAAAMGVLLAMLATWTLVHPRASASPRPARFVVNSIGWREPFAPPVPLIAISPDGARIVYAMFVDDKSQLYVRTIDQVESTAIPGTEGGYMPFFSPDSAWLAFFAAGKLKKVRLGVSAPTTICDAAEPAAAVGDRTVRSCLRRRHLPASLASHQTAENRRA
jgi:eukaryotic-like serine/threonine-protein kinase